MAAPIGNPSRHPASSLASSSPDQASVQHTTIRSPLPASTPKPDPSAATPKAGSVRSPATLVPATIAHASVIPPRAVPSTPATAAFRHHEQLTIDGETPSSRTPSRQAAARHHAQQLHAARPPDPPTSSVHAPTPATDGHDPVVPAPTATITSQQ
ncbi:hypothetical protein ACLOJK_036603 [Asimina triloba]